MNSDTLDIDGLLDKKPEYLFASTFSYEDSAAERALHREMGALRVYSRDEGALLQAEPLLGFVVRPMGLPLGYTLLQGVRREESTPNMNRVLLYRFNPVGRSWVVVSDNPYLTLLNTYLAVRI